tara:strand:- start:9372 stop:10298 length:927 start_codon:yes stop_codon:yes gene_type:complete
MFWPLMFHHFHNDQHPIVQGSISAHQLDKLLLEVKKSCTIYDPDEFSREIKVVSPDKPLCCLTFDDSLRCQSDVVLDVLDSHNIKAFFFLYTSHLDTSSPNPMLEVYRDFRCVYFNSIDSFYSAFFEQLYVQTGRDYDYYSSIMPIDHLNDCPFYSYNDRLYRYTRDFCIDETEYFSCLDSMIYSSNYNLDLAISRLLMTSKDISSLHSAGHTIGLHSHTHPTRIADYSIEQSTDEYSRNLNFLSSFTDNPIYSMSHPCGNYNSSILTNLQELGISIGFRASLKINTQLSSLEIPRIDHAVLIKEFSL